MPAKHADQLERGDLVLVNDRDWPSPVYARVTSTSAGHFADLIPEDMKAYAIKDAATVIHVEYETPVRIGDGPDDVTRMANIYHKPTDMVKYRKGNR